MTDIKKGDSLRIVEIQLNQDSVMVWLSPVGFEYRIPGPLCIKDVAPTPSPPGWNVEKSGPWKSTGKKVAWGGIVFDVLPMVHYKTFVERLAPSGISAMKAIEEAVAASLREIYGLNVIVS